MIQKLVCGIFIFMVVSVIGQDMIKGSYSYTYGDKESLVEARQTCKDLALREAIESYYIFIESSTDVENYQLKEDVIQSIAGGYLKNVKVVVQQEEGRTITMTVEASVMPDEVKALVSGMVEGKKKERVSEPVAEKIETEPVEEKQEGQSEGEDAWVKKYLTYDDIMRKAEAAIQKSQFEMGSKLLLESQNMLEKHKPAKKQDFQWLMYESASDHTALLRHLNKVQKREYLGKPLLARSSMKNVLQYAGKLKISNNRLSKLTNLTKKQSIIRENHISRCEKSLDIIRKKSSQYSKHR